MNADRLQEAVRPAWRRPPRRSWTVGHTSPVFNAPHQKTRGSKLRHFRDSKCGLSFSWKRKFDDFLL